MSYKLTKLYLLKSLQVVYFLVYEKQTIACKKSLQIERKKMKKKAGGGQKIGGMAGLFYETPIHFTILAFL